MIASRRAGREPRPPRPGGGRVHLAAQIAQPLRQRSRVIGRSPREAVEEQRLDGPGALVRVGEVVAGHPLHQVRRPVAVRPERRQRRLADDDGPLRQAREGSRPAGPRHGRQCPPRNASADLTTRRRPSSVRSDQPKRSRFSWLTGTHARPTRASGSRRIDDAGRPSPAGMRLGHASRPTHPDPPPQSTTAAAAPPGARRASNRHQVQGEQQPRDGEAQQQRAGELKRLLIHPPASPPAAAEGDRTHHRTDAKRVEGDRRLQLRAPRHAERHAPDRR